MSAKEKPAVQPPPSRRKSGEGGEARDGRPLCPTDLQRSALRSTSSNSRRVRAAPLHHRGSRSRHPRGSRRYVALFHPRLIGLSGDREAIRNAASAYRCSVPRRRAISAAAAGRATRSAAVRHKISEPVRGAAWTERRLWKGLLSGVWHPCFPEFRPCTSEFPPCSAE